MEAMQVLGNGQNPTGPEGSDCQGPADTVQTVSANRWHKSGKSRDLEQGSRRERQGHRSWLAICDTWNLPNSRPYLTQMSRFPLKAEPEEVD